MHILQSHLRQVGEETVNNLLKHSYYCYLGDDYDLIKSTTTVFILCILSGMIFIVLFAYWCCVIFVIRGVDMHNICDCCRRNDLNGNRNYTSLTCTFWIIAIIFVSLATALLMNILDSGPELFEVACEGFDFYCLELGVAALMWMLVGLFTCCNLCCYCICIRRLAGQVFGKPSIQA